MPLSEIHNYRTMNSETVSLSVIAIAALVLLFASGPIVAADITMDTITDLTTDAITDITMDTITDITMEMEYIIKA